MAHDVLPWHPVVSNSGVAAHMLLAVALPFHILLILQLQGAALQVHICLHTSLGTRLYQDYSGLCRELYKKPTQHHPLDTQVCICQGCCFFGAACGLNIQAHPFPSHGVASLTGAFLPTGPLLQDLVAALQQLQGICVTSTSYAPDSVCFAPDCKISRFSRHRRRTNYQIPT